MKVTELNNAIVFLEDIKELTVAGSISTPTRIVLSETGGATILDELHYAGFDGNITLDLAKIFTAYSTPVIPEASLLYDRTNILDLTLTVGDSPYAFTLVPFSKDSTKMISDIDYLAIPAQCPIPLSVFLTAGKGCNVYLDTLSTREAVALFPILNGSPANLVQLITPDLLDGDFRLVYNINSDELLSPLYHIRAGDYQLFLFQNRFGAMEIFPMFGALEYIPSFKLEVGKGADYHRTISSEREDILRQNSGNLTQKASLVLASFLKTGHAYHMVAGEWKRIVIEEATVNAKSSDTIHQQTFSFRYQDHIEPQFMTI